MRSSLFDQTNLELQSEQTFALQNPQLLRVHLGGDVLAVKGAMVAYQGAIRFDHEKSGTMGKLLKKVVTGEDVSLMRVSGTGDVFFASSSGFVFLIDLTGPWGGFTAVAVVSALIGVVGLMVQAAHGRRAVGDAAPVSR